MNIGNPKRFQSLGGMQFYSLFLSLEKIHKIRIILGLLPSLSGFRAKMGTVDQLMRLDSFIYDAFRNGDRVVM